jgi:hypothetical protein
MENKSKTAHISYTGSNEMRIRGTYDANFVTELKVGLSSRVWDAKTREWVVDVDERISALRLIKKYYSTVIEDNEPPLERKTSSQEKAEPVTHNVAMPTEKDYAVLHLLPTAPVELVKVAYRTLAKLYHPDTNHEPDAAKRMIRLNRAYEAIVKKQA